MSTLPFLLSVADELDNLNSQSYMDDFGLGFHPHRQYYRTPTIQLSLPASTEWIQEERGQRYRGHRFYYETQNNMQETGEENEDEDVTSGNSGASTSAAAAAASARMTTAADGSRQKYTSPLNSNGLELTTCPGSNAACNIIGNNAANINMNSKAKNKSKMKTNTNSKLKASENNVKNGDDDDDEQNIDNSVRMYNLSKKCCKNYHRHAVEANVKELGGHKCLEGNNSSSEESLQKSSSSIEFLTCFLLKRSRASSKNASASSKKS